MNKNPKKYLSIIITLFLALMIVSPEHFLTIKVYATTVNDLNPVDSTYKFLKEVEGYSEQCFWDNSQWSIGYGNKCPYSHSSNGTYYKQPGGHYISETDARNLLNERLPSYVTQLKNICNGLTMNQNQFDALLSVTYNAWSISDCPLIKYLRGSLTESQAKEQHYIYRINAGTSSEAGLRNRRKKEVTLFFTPVDDTPLPCDIKLSGFQNPTEGYVLSCLPAEKV